jgi:diacylglycerol kinase family enzyme
VRLLLVVNPFASSVTPRTTVLVNQRLTRAGFTVTIAETNRRGHASRFAQDAASRGFAAVVAMGGDGTLNEVANGLAGSTTALAPLPGGSTNVFARTIGLPNDPLAATDAMVGALQAAAVRRVGLGSVNGRYFLFHTGMGFDAAVVARVERRDSLKRWAGHPLFVSAALSTWARGYDRHHPHMALELPGEAPIEDGYFAIVLNTDPYTFFGNRPLSLAPAAGLDTALSLVAFRSLAAWRVLGTAGRAMLGRPLVDKPWLVRRDDLTSLVVRGLGPFPYQVDGDHLGDAQRLSFRHEPDALALVVPGSRAAG